LVLRGEHGAHLRDHAVEGKAALVVRADGVVIDGIECSGVRVRDNNGACVRIEGDDLTVRNVHFHDNQEGILSGPGGGLLLVENSLIERNGFGGQAHGVYVGPEVERFIFRNNRVLATTGAGHGLKSRAQQTIIESNLIAGLDGRDSRAIDIPNGGEVVIRGNVLQKGPNSEFSTSRTPPPGPLRMPSWLSWKWTLRTVRSPPSLRTQAPLLSRTLMPEHSMPSMTTPSALTTRAALPSTA
ncbi:MAG: right-handed parallel beta-helix repeat-containing protein, partial [Geminicoccaceae bacterium]